MATRAHPDSLPSGYRAPTEPSRRRAAGPGNGIRIGSVSGIDLHVDWSLLIIFFLITTSLAIGLFPAWHPDWSPGLAWATALGAAVLFFASVLAHELSHAIVGRWHGIPIRRITLFVFGGMAHLEREPHTWRGELWMAIVGPLTSIALGVLFLLLAEATTGEIAVDRENPVGTLAQLGPVPTLLLWLGQINIILAVFNLVPGFPLDGGRVLRAIIWGITGNLRQATRWASIAGQAFAWVLIATGFAMILGIRVPYFGAGLVGGIWLAFIGWFLNNAALMSYRQLILQETLQDVPIARLMHADFDAVTPDISLAAFVDEHLMRSTQRTFPVLEGGRLVGMVSLHDVRTAGRDRWDTLRVSDVMTPLERLVTASPRDDALEVLAAMGRRNVNQVPIVDGRELRGLLRREDVLKWLALYGEAEIGGRERR